MTLPAANLINLPGNIDPVQQPAIWVAFLTAWDGLRDAGRLQPGNFSF